MTGTETRCARVGCGDRYSQHEARDTGSRGSCTVCECAGFLWVPAAAPQQSLRRWHRG